MALTYQPTDDLSLYVNYSESFNPVSSGDQEDVSNEGSLQPETGKQSEIGLKNTWLDGKIMSTFAIYRINKENVVQTNPAFTSNDDGIVELLNIG